MGYGLLRCGTHLILATVDPKLRTGSVRPNNPVIRGFFGGGSTGNVVGKNTHFPLIKKMQVFLVFSKNRSFTGIFIDSNGDDSANFDRNGGDSYSESGRFYAIPSVLL